LVNIEASGLRQDVNGQPILITQGLTGYTLVAGKECLFRLFMSKDSLNIVDSIVVHILRPPLPPANPWPNIGSWIVVPKAYLDYVTDFPNGPSIGLIIRGFAFPVHDKYSVAFSIRTVQGVIIQELLVDGLVFRPTQDLRILVVPTVGTARHFIVTQQWLDDINWAMLRLSCMLPFRDCVIDKLSNNLLVNSSHGLRYRIGNPI
jgi:hypothetical protein